MKSRSFAASLRLALELAPTDTQVMRAAAMLAGNLGRLDEAIDMLQQAAARDPLNVPVHRSLAAACMRAGRLDEAEAAAITALEMNPRGGLTNSWVGTVRLQQGRLDEALEMYQSEGNGLVGIGVNAEACQRQHDKMFVHVCP